ncbi:unnamed protein product, partial [Anisakis simplex]|uniref:LSM domain-containing protein n=1 Tax=Anisakis simplex TaxID=6269 RepID=A0A0M3K284_ANISI
MEARCYEIQQIHMDGRLSGSLHELPRAVEICIESEDPFALCRVRHNSQFCENLEMQCYNLENIPVVRRVAGVLVELPEAIIICMKS